MKMPCHFLDLAEVFKPQSIMSPWKLVPVEIPSQPHSVGCVPRAVCTLRNHFADLICVFDTSQNCICPFFFDFFKHIFSFKVCCFGTACWRFTRMQALRKVFASIKGYYFQALMSWKDGVGKMRIILLFVGYVFVTLVLSALQTGSAEPWRKLGYAQES